MICRKTDQQSALARRLGTELYAKRLKRQHDKFTKLLHQESGIFRLERILPFKSFLALALKASGLHGMMRAGYLDIRLEQVKWFFPNLPPAFEGFRLLQISDLHCDLDPSLMPLVIDLVGRTPHDAVVLTGDYRNGMDGDYEAALKAMSALRRFLADECWSVLGNHDPLEMALDLEREGFPVLLNETVEVRRKGDAIWIAGVDDPHYYQTHDLAGTKLKAPQDGFVILLSHSPETYAEAAGLGFNFQLSGHTHGGQICLPGGRHLIAACRIPRPFIAGAWCYGDMQGYTSRGTGACGVAARWNCPPEVTLHLLHRAKR